MSPAERHRRARAAFLSLRAMGAAVVDGPMFTGTVHGPWLSDSREFEWTWRRPGSRSLDALVESLPEQRA